jgi:hypothetical protein
MVRRLLARSHKNLFRWLSPILVITMLGLATWFLLRPPAKVVAVGSLSLPKPIEKCWVETHGKRQALIIVAIEDGQSWQVMIQGSKLVCEPIQQLRNAIEIRAGFFDMDKDGYPEFFRAEFDTIWVFKRKESVKGKIPKHHSLPSWFPLPNRHRWLVWAKIGVGDGYCPTLTFITEPDQKQPRKVVAWIKNSSSGGFLFVLSPDGRRLIPFNSGGWKGLDFWREVMSVEDLDHDGVCEVIARGRSYERTSPGHIGIYKWDGRTYQLWWTSPRKGEYVVDAKMCDLDGDGTKEIVAVLDLKGQSDLRALAVYQLNGRRYQKVAQHRLPNEPALPCPDLAAVVPTPQGCVIAIERSNDKVLFFRYWQDKFHLIGQVVGVTPVGYSKVGTDLFVTDLKERWLLSLLFQRLPSKLRIQLANIFGSESRPITKVVSWDGKQLRSTRTLPGEGGGIQNALWQDVLWDEWVAGRTSLGNWVLLGEPIRWKLRHGEEIPTLARYRLFLGANGRYRSIWHIHTTVTEEGFPQAFPADLDGDGADELVLVDTVKDKLQVFKIQ